MERNEYTVWKVRLTPMTPFLIGGSRIIHNHFETLDYIPSKVLQAAFSRAILESHTDYNIQEHLDKRYYIEKEFQSKLDGCRPEWKAWLKNFDSISFSDATPFGANRYTPTTYQCKSYDDHPLRETIRDRYLLSVGTAKEPIQDFKCEKCKRNRQVGRLVRKNGWNLSSNQKIYRRLITRVEIDPKRLVAADERLYSMAIGEPFSYINRETGETKPLDFIGYVYTPKSIADHLNIDGEQNVFIHVGADITSGLGEMKVEVSMVDSLDELEKECIEKIQHWREKLPSKRPKSVCFQFNSNVLFDLEDEDKESLNRFQTNENMLNIYTKWLQHSSNLPEDCKVSYTQLQFFQRRGFVVGSNHSRKKEIENYIQNGSVMVIEGDSVDDWAIHSAVNGMTLMTSEGSQQIPIQILSGDLKGGIKK